MHNYLEEFKKKLNYFFNTNQTIQQNYTEYKTAKIDYSDSVKIIDIVTRFNELYLNFKEDLKSLKKLDLSKDIILLNGDKDFAEFYLSGVKDEIYNEDGEAILRMTKICGPTRCFVCNNYSSVDDYKEQSINIDTNIIESYFDFFDRNKEFIDLYNFFRDKNICGKLGKNLFTKVNGNILNELTEFELFLGEFLWNGESTAKINFKLGDNLKIDKVYVKLLGEVVLDKKEKDKITLDLLNSIYVGEKYLPNVYTNSKLKQKKII